VLYYKMGPDVQVWARPAMNPTAEIFIASHIKFPKWIPNSYNVLYTTAIGSLESKNVVNKARREWLPPSSEVIQNPIGWIAPETSSLMIALLNETRHCIQIYETVPAVKLSKEICNEALLITSPEVFVLKDRSYISFQTNREISYNHDIFVASAIDLPSEAPILKRTSSNVKRTRKDPEPFVPVGGDRAYIYYTASTLVDSVEGPRGIWMTEFLGRE